MKIIFAKYNRERLPRFQTITKIIEEDRRYKVLKQPLSLLAKDHIKEIKHNYSLLVERYPQIKLCKPTLIGDNIEFEFIQGETFERLLKQELDRQNKTGFLNLIERYIKYVDSFVTEKNIKFIPHDNFEIIFGKCTVDQPQDVIGTANVDLSFSNIFEYKNEVTVIDYEWVFDFPIPKAFIIWRAIASLYMFYGEHYSKLISLEDLLNEIGISDKYREIFTQMEQCFQKYVHGEKFIFFLNPLCLQPKINIKQKLAQSEQDISQLNQQFVESKNALDEVSQRHLELNQNLNETQQKWEQSSQICQELHQNLVDINQNLNSSNQNNAELSRQNKELSQQNTELNQKILAIENSRSWRITAPLRKLSRKINYLIHI